MERQAWAFVTVVAAFALALGACGKQADTQPNAPGGSADTAEVVRPAAPDGPPGGSSGVVGSGPYSGASGGDVIPGTTGSGRSQTAQPGAGLGGGLGGGNSAAMGAPATPGGSGSSNATSSSAVGQRP